MVGIRKIEAALAATNGGDATGLHTRLQYLNLQRFPPGLRVGPARRVNYDLDEAYAFALWFSLTQAAFTPLAAMALVTDFWPELTRLFLAASQKAGVSGIAVPNPDETIAVIYGNALTMTARPSPSNLEAVARPFDITSATHSNLAGRLGGGLAASVVIDLVTVRSALVSALKADPEPLDQSTLDQQITSVAIREGWSPEAKNGAPIPEIRRKEIPPRGEKLGERDYYFSRAIEFIDTIGNRPERAALTPRLERIAGYLLTPSPREEWKRWVEVADSGRQFIWGIGALLAETTTVTTHLPETLVIGAASVIADGDTSALAVKLRATAERARDYEPLPGANSGGHNG